MKKAIMYFILIGVITSGIISLYNRPSDGEKGPLQLIVEAYNCMDSIINNIILRK
jgi:hypothetical protein